MQKEENPNVGSIRGTEKGEKGERGERGYEGGKRGDDGISGEKERSVVSKGEREG